MVKIFILFFINYLTTFITKCYISKKLILIITSLINDFLISVEILE